MLFFSLDTLLRSICLSEMFKILSKKWQIPKMHFLEISSWFFLIFCTKIHNRNAQNMVESVFSRLEMTISIQKISRIFFTSRNLIWLTLPLDTFGLLWAYRSGKDLFDPHHNLRSIHDSCRKKWISREISCLKSSLSQLSCTLYNHGFGVRRELFVSVVECVFEFVYRYVFQISNVLWHCIEQLCSLYS